MKYLFVVIFFLFVSFSAVAEDESKTLSYVSINHNALSKLMWTYGIHDPKNNEILDHYLVINNCDLYTRYKQDEFLWQKIREGARREIDYYAYDYPNRFEITAVVPLERYDFDRSAFIIDKKFSLTNAGAIQIPLLSKDTCYERGQELLFPKNIKFAADNRFSLTEIPVAPSQAQEILNRIKKYKYKDMGDVKAVPLKFKIKINGVKSYELGTYLSHVVFKGQLDEITFYEDPQMTKPIWKKSFKVLN